MLEYQQSYIFSSDPNNGAINVAPDGSSFTVQLNNPIHIPHEAKNCTLEVTQANIWNTSPNISARLGNNVFYYIVGGTTYSFVIADGLYSLNALNNLLQLELEQNTATAAGITMSGDESTQTIVFTFTDTGIGVDFTQTNTPRELLGFDSRIATATPGPTTTLTDQGDFVAAFNSINSFLLHSDLVSNGIPVNAIGAAIISQVPIDVKPGSQIVYQPRNPPRVDANQLIGKSVNQIRNWITSQKNILIDTASETFDFLVVIRYWV